MVGRKKWACARQLELGLQAKAPPVGRKWSRVGKNRGICSRSESVLSEGKRIDKVGGVDIVSAFKTGEGQLVSIPVKVDMENGSLRDAVGS